jgi:hypothetical protein
LRRLAYLDPEAYRAAKAKHGRVFNTVQEAETAGLPKGTVVIVGGRRAVIE